MLVVVVVVVVGVVVCVVLVVFVFVLWSVFLFLCVVIVFVCCVLCFCHPVRSTLCVIRVHLDVRGEHLELPAQVHLSQLATAGRVQEVCQ